jgi:hypothetical protein
MRLTELPAREGGVHECLCTIYYSDGRSNPCGVWVESLDQPFCGTCENRHPELEGAYGTQVGTKVRV